MKKIITTFVTAIALAVVALTPANAASAPRILSLNASQAGGTISINGTAETHMLAAAISVYAADDTTNALTVETASVNNGVFSHDIALAAGNYKVCAANYDGGDQFCIDLTTATTEEVTNTTEEESTTAGSPETGYNKASDGSAATTDNTWMIVAAVAVVLIGATTIVLARRHARAQAKQAKK